MLRPISPFIEYLVDKDYIAEFLCINKDKPEMACGGKCHLMKQVEQQDKELPKGLRISFEEYPIGFVKVYQKQTTAELIVPSLHSFGYHQQYSYLYCPQIFHPPTI